MSKAYAYLRIDPKELKPERSIERQKKKIKDKYIGVHLDFVLDNHSGDSFDRPGWNELRKRVKPGDRIIVQNLHILSTSTWRITIKEIENFQNRRIDVDILEFETKVIKSLSDLYCYFESIRLNRQLASIASIATNEALRKLKYQGRAAILEPTFLYQLKDTLSQYTMSPTELCQRLGMSRSTIYKALKLIDNEERKS